MSNTPPINKSSDGDEGGEIGGGSGKGEGLDHNQSNIGNGVGIRGWNTFGELAWKRRDANDPAMMRELKRYQKLMLLTLLPSISGEAEPSHLHRLHYHDAELTHDAYTRDMNTTDVDSAIDTNHNEHLPKPEPKDTIVTGGKLDKSLQHAKSAGVHRTKGGRNNDSGSASAGTRLPLTVYNPLNTSPRRSNRRSQDEGMKRSRRNTVCEETKDEGREVVDIGSVNGSPGGGSVGNTTAVGGTGGDLDLLTLAALYLESRHRVFGQEWHYRPDSQSNIRPGAQVGTTGISRPRRLSPLPNEAPTIKQGDNHSKRNSEHRRSFSGVHAAPAGLHLSVNYTQNLNLDESSYFAERARALKPRLRRLNSLDDLVSSPLDSSQQSLYRPTSAPDLSQSAQGKHLYIEKQDSQLSLESISPPLVTPARANTPTGARHSAALTRPQIVGGSLATYSALDPSTKAKVSKFSGHPDKTKTISQFEGSRTILLQPPPKTGRTLGAISHDSNVLDVPKAPPPSAAVESSRKNGKIHLEPLTIRKTSY